LNMKKSTTGNQPKRAENIRALVAYFESGINEEEKRLGIELEHTIVQAVNNAPVSYTQEYGAAYLLEKLRSDYPDATFDSKGDLLGVSRLGEAVTIEPAAQIELSAGPFDELEDALACFERFESKLVEILEPVGQKAILVGYHPTAKAEDLELIPKRRYKFMNFYLSEIGPFGQRMMRGTASTQVSIDYSSVSDCLRKLRLSFALVPVFSLISDNTAIYEGEPRPHQLMRTEIWLECDPARCGLVPGVMDLGFSLERYAEYILDTPAIIVPCENHEWCYSDETFGERYADKVMDRKAIEHAVSMFFNDVRLKTYVEIRPADAMEPVYAIAYAALIKGLFYSEASLDALDVLFAGVDEKAINEAKQALMAQGYGAEIYGQPVDKLVDTLMKIAKTSLSDADYNYLKPLEELTKTRTTLADISGK